MTIKKFQAGSTPPVRRTPGLLRTAPGSRIQVKNGNGPIKKHLLFHLNLKLGSWGLKLFFLLLCAAPILQAEMPPSEIFSTMVVEMERAKAQLHFEDYPRPYFISLRAVKTAAWQQGFRDGEEVFSSHDERWYLTPQVRVGDYLFDQSPDTWDPQRSDAPVSFSDNVLLARHHIRNAIDDSYKQACSLYLQKKAKRSAEGVPEYAADDLAYLNEAPLVKLNPDVEPPAPLFELMKSYNSVLSLASKSLSGEPLILRSLARADADSRRSYLVTTEGVRAVSDTTNYQVYLSLFGNSQAGMPLHVMRQLTGYDLNALPALEKLQTEISEMKKEFHLLYASKEAKSAIAPCLLDNQSSAELFLAFAAKLEGERQRDPQEPQTFRGKINQQVLPDFLTITDDPMKVMHWEEPLVGHYDYDEEGVRSKKIVLVEKGVLKNFLLSRRPVKGIPVISNGHGRAAPDQLPHARAANLFVESSKDVEPGRLKELLLEEVKKRRLPFGIRLEGLKAIPQEDRTGAHQTFRGAPKLMYYVYPNGREELAHHGEVVGTPIKLMQSIIATGDDAEVFNMLRGGPGGELPTSVISPSILISEIEVQKGSSRPVRPPILKSPLEE
ncbi:MAG: hypothetical protein HY547_02905 [Elusimicrobia bacterium]|nr:hypothetical protein [Elusimicrobiota bacterium]